LAFSASLNDRPEALRGASKCRLLGFNVAELLPTKLSARLDNLCTEAAESVSNASQALGVNTDRH